MTRRLWQAPQGYYWKVVVDPTRTGDDPGIFYGGHFRKCDIIPLNKAEDDPCPWPNGTVFENIRTGERVEIRNGKAICISSSASAAAKLPITKDSSAAPTAS